MKRIGAVIFLVMIISLFCACVHTQGGPGSQTVSPILNRIQKTGELVVGTAGTMPPLNMTTKSGEIIGFEPDLARYMAHAMGAKLRLKLMPFNDLLPALEAGKVDMILSNMTITGGRNMKTAFVGPYYVSGKAFLTKSKTIASIKHGSEINSPDRTLVALKGSTSQVFTEEIIPKAKLVLTNNYDEAVNMVLNGKADALVAEYPICMVSLFRYPDAGLVSISTRLNYEPIGIALPPNDPLLVNWVENCLNSIEGSGGLDLLKKEWFEDRSWLKKLK